MSGIVVKGESVYKCTVCTRSIRVTTNKQGLDVLQRCNITHGCQGKLRRVTLAKEINSTPAFPPEVQGVNDWFQRRVLYTHEQPVQSTTWLLRHNLANRPKIYAFVNQVVQGTEQLVPIEPTQETIIDSNTIQLTFAVAVSGLAQCVSLTSQAALNIPTMSTIAETEAVQISNNIGEITLATLTDAPYIGLALTYLTAGASVSVTIEYAGIGIIPTVTSPWAGVRNAVINGKLYTLRSFNLITTPLAPAYYRAGIISNGSRFYVNNYQGSAPTSGDCLILLGQSPYATVDKVYNKIIDVSSLNPVSPELYYTSNTALAFPSIVKQTYPLILVV